jgi:hypothetical protein
MAGAYVGLVLYQLVTIILFNKKFVWTDGAQLMVGYRAKGLLTAMHFDQARVDKRGISERVIIPSSMGADVSLSLALSSVTAKELLSRIEIAAKRASTGAT